MGKVNFKVLENTKVGTHSFYAKAVPTGKLSFEDAVKFACKGTDIEESAMKRDVVEFMKTVQDFTLLGYRVEIGPQFLTVYPVLDAKVKDQLNPDKTVKKAAEAKDVKSNIKGAVSRLGCTVSPNFSKRFDMEVQWQKIDANGNAVDDEETDITQGNDGGSDNGGDDNGGNGGNEGGGAGGLE